MIELKRVLAPIDNTPFDEICSFETENYVGVFVDSVSTNIGPGYVVMPKDDLVFSIEFLECPDTLEKLDEIVYDKIDEHISCVSTSRAVTISINEIEQ